MDEKALTNTNEKTLKALEYDKILEKLAQKCSCEDSRRMAAELRPFSDKNEAERNLNDTEDASNLTLRFGGPSFFGLKNVAQSLQRAKLGGLLSPRELLDIAGVLATIRALFRYRENTSSIETGLSPLFDSLSPNKYIEDQINSAILSEEEIADTASPELADIRRQKRSRETRVRSELDRLIHSPNRQKFLQDPVVTIRSGRFVVPVKAENKGDVPGLVHDTSSSGATVFVEPMNVVELNNEIKILDSREQKEIERILYSLSAEAGSFADSIDKSLRTAIKLDFIFAKARLALDMRAFRPKTGVNGTLSLQKARHPLIDPKKVVAVDISLGLDFDSMVITGPNTGGKTVALKTVGLLTLMAMSGLMLPADENSSVGFFTSIYADIGDEQSIEQSLSTFSAHMTNIVDILGRAEADSLVLIDELGSGTDPVEGAALAVSILEQLRQRGVRVAATTHYAELKAYALQTARVENACCEFNTETLRPTYRLLIGVPGRSNAFAISSRLGLEPEIIDNAKALISSENSRFEDVVEQLEESRRRLETEKTAASHEKAEANRARLEAEQLRNKLETEHDRTLEKAQREAKRLLEETRAQADALLNELEELKKKKGSEDISSLYARAKAGLNTRVRKLEETADPVGSARAPVFSRPPEKLKAGDTVTLLGINKKATVITAPDEAGMVEVRAGIITTRVNISELRKADDGADFQAARTVITNIDRSSRQAKPEFDMRGMNVEEGLLELDKFLDDAQISGLTQVSVIHGKGTGVLCGAVQQHLKTLKQVKSFRLGRYGEGETGVTIVELE